MACGYCSQDEKAETVSCDTVGFFSEVGRGTLALPAGCCHYRHTQERDFQTASGRGSEIDQQALSLGLLVNFTHPPTHCLIAELPWRYTGEILRQVITLNHLNSQTVAVS